MIDEATDIKNILPENGEWIEAPLTMDQQYRLVEISHTTSDPEVRRAAMAVLQKALNPLMKVRPMEGDHGPKLLPPSPIRRTLPCKRNSGV